MPCNDNNIQRSAHRVVVIDDEDGGHEGSGWRLGRLVEETSFRRFHVRIRQTSSLNAIADAGIRIAMTR
jgi:hypothetical protein